MPRTPIPLTDLVNPTGHEAVTLQLDLNPRAFAGLASSPDYCDAADQLEAIANGDRAAALGACVGSLLDLCGAGHLGAASNALGAAVELSRRIVAARVALRAEA